MLMIVSRSFGYEVRIFLYQLSSLDSTALCLALSFFTILVTTYGNNAYSKIKPNLGTSRGSLLPERLTYMRSTYSSPRVLAPINVVRKKYNSFVATPISSGCMLTNFCPLNICNASVTCALSRFSK